MSPRHPIPVIHVPEHHLGAMSLVILTRAPDDAALRAAARLADSAATAAWSLRSDDLRSLSRVEYRQLLDYTAAPQVLDLAFYLRGDRTQIRTLMDHITREIAGFLAHYAPPSQP